MSPLPTLELSQDEKTAKYADSDAVGSLRAKIESANGGPNTYGCHPLSGTTWAPTSKPIGDSVLASMSTPSAPNPKPSCLVPGINPEAHIFSGPGAETPLHYEDLLTGAFNLLLGYHPKV